MVDTETLVLMSGTLQVCSEITAELDGVVERVETYTLSLQSSFAVEQSASTLTVNVLSMDSKSVSILVQINAQTLILNQLCRDSACICVMNS